ncbi:MAG: peptidoglycan editing factor PgeF [Armatimonadota bacterium]|nr:peptidoglycan editing factor PgeF [Armatimonadota bacterium]MDR5697162.1 peptidoglycan editing factor PgeF [Armatimonadota bacterium]
MRADLGPDFHAVDAAGVACIRSRLVEGLGEVRHAFTTRRGDGDDPLADPARRRRVLRGLGFAPERVVQIMQVHGAAVVEARAADAGSKLGPADAVVTAEADVPLSVHTADCVPLLLVDPNAGVVGAVHAGWRGLGAGVVGAAVGAMERRGARASRVVCAIGPSIGPCCYEVDAPVRRALGAWAHALWPGRAGHWMADLRAVAVAQLRQAGVPAERIAVCPACTACHPEWFFSYRRDGRTGRMEALIALRRANGNGAS